MPPGCFGIGAFGAAVPRRPGPGLDVGPAGGQRGAAVLVHGGDAGLQQLVAGRLQVAGGRAAGLVLAERFRDQPAGVLGLPVGELVRPAVPVLGDAGPHLVGFGQGRQRGADLGEIGRAAVIDSKHHPGQQGPRAQLPVPHAGRQQRLDRRRGAGGIDDGFDGSEPGPAAHGRVTGPRRRAGRPRRIPRRDPAWRRCRPAAGSR